MYNSIFIQTCAVGADHFYCLLFFDISTECLVSRVFSANGSCTTMYIRSLLYFRPSPAPYSGQNSNDYVKPTSPRLPTASVDSQVFIPNNSQPSRSTAAGNISKFLQSSGAKQGSPTFLKVSFVDTNQICLISRYYQAINNA